VLRLESRLRRGVFENVEVAARVGDVPPISNDLRYPYNKVPAGKRGGTSNDSRDIMKGPSAEATRSRGLFWDFRCKLHALAPLSLP